MRRRLMAVLLALSAGLSALVGFTTPAGADTNQAMDGVIRPCNWQNGDDGWFNTYRGIVNCSIQNNHIVVDLYGNYGIGGGQGGYYYQGAVDIWFQTDTCGQVLFTDPGTKYDPAGMFRVLLDNGLSTSAQCAPQGTNVESWYSLNGQSRTYPFYAPGAYVSQYINSTAYGSGTRVNHLTGFNGCEINSAPWWGDLVTRARGTNSNPYGTASVQVSKRGAPLFANTGCAKSHRPTVVELFWSP